MEKPMTVVTGKDAEAFARAAYQDGQNTILFSTNKPYIAPAFFTPHTAVGIGVLAAVRGLTNRNWSGNDRTGEVKQQAKMARLRHYGNCQEYSVLAFDYLLTRNINRIDYIAITQWSGDHAVCVLGRLPNSKENDYTTWGPPDDVWVIDGWKKELYPIGSGKFKQYEKNKYGCWARFD
jgi:hypothetical protein